MIPPRKSVGEVTPYPLNPGTRRDKIRLDLNESAWGCSPKVLEALRRIERMEVSTYPVYHDFLSQIAAQRNLPPENIMITNGADDAIRILMQTYIEPGDEVVVAEPSFGMITLQARIAGATLRPVRYGSDLAFPVEGFRAVLNSKTRLLAIVRPDSPTGGRIRRADLIDLLREAPQAVVMLDETYWHFCGESCVDLLAEYPNLVILQSFSKAYGLAGMRLGMVFAAAESIAEYRKVNPPFSVNALAMLAGMAALADQAYLEEVLQAVETEKAYLAERMNSLGLETRTSPANFVLAHIGAEADRVHTALLAQNIFVKNLSSQPPLEGWFRITAGTRRENDILLNALKEILS